MSDFDYDIVNGWEAGNDTLAAYQFMWFIPVSLDSSALPTPAMTSISGISPMPMMQPGTDYSECMHEPVRTPYVALVTAGTTGLRIAAIRRGFPGRTAYRKRPDSISP